MAHGERERFQGTPTAVATRVNLLAGTALTFLATNLARDSFSVLPVVGSIFLGYGVAVPTSTLDFGPLPAAAVYRDESYVGPIYAAVPSGASGVACVLDLGGGESG